MEICENKKIPLWLPNVNHSGHLVLEFRHSAFAFFGIVLFDFFDGVDIKHKPERAALTDRAHNSVPCVVSVKYALYDRESESGADNAAAVFFVYLVVSFPDILELIGRDTLAVVGYFDLDLAALRDLCNDDGLVLADMVYRVVHKVVNNLRDPQLVGVYKHVFFVIEDDVVAVLFNKL